ncbi:MAG: TonB family protein, partial [Bacteroidota bacterium]
SITKPHFLMSTKKSPSDNLENYILAVEKKEKQMRAVKLALIAILISGGSVLAYFMGVQPYMNNSSYHRFFASELSFELVDSLLNNSQKPILVKHAGSETFDTIRKIEDYVKFELDGSSELIVVDDNGDNFLDDVSDSFDTNPVQTANIALDIAGDRKAGNKLSFKIIPLGEDKLPLYEIDFGNGLKKQIKSSIKYAYPTAGNYFVYVRSADGQSQTLYKLPLRIGSRASMATNEGTKEMVKESTTNPEVNNRSSKSSKPSVNQTQESNSSMATTSSSKRTNVSSKNPYALGSSGLSASTREVPKVAPTVVANPPKEMPSTETKSATSEKRNTESFDPNAVFETPSFPGGSKSMSRFVARRLRYPRMAINNKVEGIVIAKFDVDEAGNISNPKIVKSLGFGCDEEVLRIVGTMPNWEPGTKNGEPIKAIHSIAIKFEIQN